VLAFWGGLVMAGSRYPSEYDWRYITVSSLLYPDHNPNGYLWAWAGMVLCALGGLYSTLGLAQDWPQRETHGLPAGLWALGFGYISMVCCALLPERILRTPKGHEALALAAFIAVCIGLAQLTFSAVQRSARTRGLPGAPRAYAGVLAGLLVSPAVLAGVAQAYVSIARPTLPWVGIAWRARGIPVYLSFAFWEWITCAVFSLYMIFLFRMTLVVRR
jgi:hypothetical protein